MSWHLRTNHQRDFDDAIKRPGRFDLLVHMRPPTWADKLKLLKKFWPGSQTDEDMAAVRERLSDWVPLDHELASVLDRFTFDEFKSFLESIGKGQALKTEVEKMDEEQFHQKVDKWGKDYLALHSGMEQQADAELSLLQEFQLDEEASSVQ
jgi:SpoVK/Ycf46/Vps4 family AAA+-type ATPase